MNIPFFFLFNYKKFAIIVIDKNRGGILKSIKGQALLEFVLILPIFLMMFIGIIDFGNILYKKNQLENIMGDVVEMLSTELTDNQVKANIDEYYNGKLQLNIINKDSNTYVNLSTFVNVYTPGLDIVMTTPFKVETNRVIYNG